MLFNSFAFALFFPLVTLVYFSLKPQLRWSWLLLASGFFYAFFIPEYLLILFALILLDFGTGLWIEGVRPEAKRAVLGVSLAANLGLLFVFKYFDFFSVNLASSLQFFGINITPPLLEMVLPLGLSFHTFQSMAYTIEVYRGRQRAERHLGYYALYVLFYPQLVAGPIERATHLLPQFFKLRPDNFPTIRLSQLIHLISKKQNLFSQILLANSYSEITQLLKSETSEYWKSHYNFSKKSKTKSKILTDKFIDLLIINTIIPIKFCYEKNQGKLNIEELISLLEAIPSEKNSIIDKFSEFSVKSINAFQSQSLLELKNEYCNKNKCLKCAVALQLLKN